MQNDSSTYKVPHLEDFEDDNFETEPEAAPETMPSSEPEVISNTGTETTPNSISIYQELNAIAEEIEQCRKRNT